MELSTTQNKIISLAKRLQKFLNQEIQTVRQTKTYERNYNEEVNNMLDGIVTKLCSVDPAYQAKVLKDVLAAKKDSLYVSVRYDTNEDFFDGYEVFTMTEAELSNYESSGGLWTYVSAETFLNNSSSYSY